ncbi:DUF6518 family protein [Neobacillus vireti]|uniref:Uncharacterized protein n=1 Tax=Neobacillus vireti LMG 21834 TaxID=1131730 RepID=A0AB94ISC2_9BACI|nr:DUF6518 family protein [Neobacillus vireti]ETI69989.1 hypothetical protein BAVI_04809 [Neobacillus vireti LMG 21834]KLT15156.1 hypothetical protein AA980_25105 [Neobacillus vireti]
MKEKLVYIRAKSDKVPPLQQRLLRVLFVFLLGALLGFLAKFSDGSVKGLIGTYLSFWIVITTIIAFRSRSPKAAALHTFIFLMAMLLVYYFYSMVLFGFFSMDYFITWGGIALLSPIGGYAVWYAKGNGWIAALCAALPISLLLVEGYSFFYSFGIPKGFDIISAVLLFFLLPANHFQRLRMLPIVTMLFFLIERLEVLYYLP